MLHRYRLDVVWQGNLGTGTSGYREYDRSVIVTAEGKPPVLSSADPAFRGAAERWNPEELLVAALAECHLLSYLHSAVRNDIVVTGYRDQPIGTMEQTGDGGRFTEVLLRPEVTISADSTAHTALSIHAQASANCFIAASVNFPVRHEPTVVVQI